MHEPFTFSRLLDPIELSLVAMMVAIVIGWRASVQREVRVRGALDRGALDRGRRARVGYGILLAGWATLYFGACPVAQDRIIHRIESRGDDVDAALRASGPGHAALVILSGGRASVRADRPPSEWLDPVSESRVLAGARLYHEHERSFGEVIMSGGPDSIALAMADLAGRLGVPPDRIVLEAASTDTRQNARNVVAAMRAAKLERAVIVTSAIHLPRALRYFRREGVEAIGAPAGIDSYAPDRPLQLTSLLPLSKTTLRGQFALHELAGDVAQAIGR